MAEAALMDDQQEHSIELEEELRLLSPTQKTALLMMLLGEEEAASILTHLEPREVQHLGAAMVSIQEISQEAVSAVLDEFVATIKHQTSLGFGTSDYVETVLVKALGEDKASSVMGRIMPRKSTGGLEILRWMDARSISEMIRGEHPQIIAIILAFLDYSLAADVLSYLDEAIRPEVMMRVANLETIQPEALDELEVIMKQQFSNNSAVKSSSVGGVVAAAKIMNFVKVDLESQVMSGLNELDPDITQRIQDNMFTFENLVSVDNRGIQTLMRGVEPDMLMTALKGAPEFVKEKFFDNMSSRARVMFIDEMEGKGPLRIADVEEAQKNIMRLARKMSDAGELVLVGRGDDFV